jgi:hypothetical protein
MAQVTVYRGNYGDTIAWTLYQADGVTPFNLAGFTVMFKVWNGANILIVNSAADILVHANGTVSYTIKVVDFVVAGDYKAAFYALAAGVEQTFEPFPLEVLNLP